MNGVPVVCAESFDITDDGRAAYQSCSMTLHGNELGRCLLTSLASTYLFTEDHIGTLTLEVRQGLLSPVKVP